MQITVQQLPKSEILLTIEVPQELFTTYEDQATRKISENIEISGFRKGQAPKAFVISHIGADAFFQEVLNVALPASYFEAIKEQNLQVISRPEIKVLSKNPLKYEARVAVFPEITFKNYEKIKIPSTPVAVTEEEIEAVITEMRKYRATYKPLERPIAKGDRLEIDFQGYDEAGKALEKTKSANHPLFVGEGTLVDGFEEKLVGMEPGSTKKFPVTFPKDFHYEPLKAKTVHFEVAIKRAEEPLLPELDEVFIKDVMGESKTVPEFRGALKEDLIRRKALEDRRSRENQLLEKFLNEARFDVPPVLLNEEIDYMVSDLKRDVEAKGLKFSTYLEQLKAQGKDPRVEFNPEAEKRVRIRLILHFLFQKMEISVSEDEVKLAQAKLLERTKESERAALQQNLSARGDVYLRLRNNLMLEKLFGRFWNKPTNYELYE